MPMFTLKRIFFFLSCICFSEAILANPQLQNVQAGSATVTQGPGTTVVNQGSDKVIINWHKFNINQGEHTRFVQPAGGVALNRINASHGASKIYGQLSATGQIILINPAGIYFGPTARVNVGGVIASTSDISDENFLGGNYVFNQPSPYGGSIMNEGKIIARENGLVALLGNNVTNTGHIEARMGNVILATGSEFTLSFNGDQLVNFTVDAKSQNGGRITNTGTIAADGGRVMMSARGAANVLDNTINMKGMVHANTVAQQNGEIILMADNGTANVSGKLVAGGVASGTTGGNIKIFAKKINIDNAAYIYASGDAGGGTITLAGSPNSNSSWIGVNQCAWVKAFATTSGNGGTITLASDKMDIAGGLIALAMNGDGGTVNLYGKDINLNAGGSVLVSGSNRGGTLRVGTNPYGDGNTSRIDKSILALVDASSYGTGGNITFNADTISTSGLLLANGYGAASSGGSISLLGNKVYVNLASKISATGETTGGRITIRPNDPSGSSLMIMPFTYLTTSATGVDGSGGRIQIGLFDTTTIYGNLSAKSSGAAGVGGLLDITGKAVAIKSTADLDVSADWIAGTIRVGTNPFISQVPASDSIVIERGAHLNAAALGQLGLGGGSVTLFAKDTTVNARINANANAAGTFGGQVNIFATDNVILGSKAAIDVSGDAFGGTVNIGGTRDGAGIQPNAMNTTVEAGSVINASAFQNGNGGPVVIWGEGTTTFAGAVKSTGGSMSGDGGEVQIVGKETLNNTGTVDVSAPNGNPGTVTYDP